MRLGEQVLHGLVLDQLLSELLARARVLHGHREQALARAEDLEREAQPAQRQRARTRLGPGADGHQVARIDLAREDATRIERVCRLERTARRGDVRQGKLYYLRGLEGKKARIKEDLAGNAKAKAAAAAAAAAAE